MPQADLVIARVIAHLDQEGRKRLDLFLENFHKKSSIQFGINFYTFENDFVDIMGIETFRASMRKGKLQFFLQLKGGLIWEHSKLTVGMNLPDTVINGMRGKMLNQIVDHPLFEGIKISSARKIDNVGQNSETFFVIEPKKTPLVEIASIQSYGESAPVNIEDTLYSLNVVDVCKVAANILEALSPDSRQAAIKRLSQGKSKIDITDLLPFNAEDIKSAHLYLQDDTLKLSADVFNGRFSTGYLGIYGGSQSHYRVMRTGVFLPYRSFYGSKVRKPRELTIPVEKLHSMLEVKYDKAA